MIESLDCKIKVIVKPHYRQDRIDEFEALTDKYDFANLAKPGELCSNILRMSTICMSISSSVIFEAMTNYKPCIIYNPNHKFDYDVYESGICYPEINFVTDKVEDTLELVNNMVRLLGDYKTRYDNYIINNNCVTNWISLFDLSDNKKLPNT
jgi:CDP-glycerol glycerophosphotransferase (TagB/SpsB family)